VRFFLPLCYVICLQEKLEDTKGVIRSHKSKGRQYNDQKRTNGQTMVYINITKKTKDRATGIPIKTVELGCFREGKQFMLHMWRPSCHNLDDSTDAVPLSMLNQDVKELFITNFSCKCLFISFHRLHCRCGFCIFFLGLRYS